MQDEDIQDQLKKEKKQMVSFLAKHRRHEGVDFIQSRRAKVILEEDEGKDILDEILPKLAAILHKNGFFSKTMPYDIRPMPGSTGITDLRSR